MNCNPQLTVFNFEEVAQVRVTTKDGQPWFIAKDVCDVLEVQNVTQAVSQLDDDERSMFYIGRQGKVNIINESGLYALIMRSNKPRARKFRKWVTSEVLPSIRRTGSYAQPELPLETPAIGEFSALRYKGLPVIPTCELRRRLGVTSGQLDSWLYGHRPMTEGADYFHIDGLSDKLILSVIKAGFELNPQAFTLCLYTQSGYNKAAARFGSAPASVSVPAPAPKPQAPASAPARTPLPELKVRTDSTRQVIRMTMRDMSAFASGDLAIMQLLQKLHDAGFDVDREEAEARFLQSALFQFERAMASAACHLKNALGAIKSIEERMPYFEGEYTPCAKGISGSTRFNPPPALA